MKKTRTYLIQSFLTIMLSVMIVFGIGVWASVHLYLSHYLYHLRRLTGQEHQHGTIGQSHLGLVTLHHFLSAMELSLVIAAAFATFIGWLVALYISRTLTRSLIMVTQGARAVTHGATNVVISPAPLAELADLATALNRVSHTFVQAEQARRARLEELAHEIRTPLMALSSYSRTLTLHKPSHAPSFLDREIERINRLTTHLPDAAPLTSYFYHTDAVRSDVLVEPIWELYRPLLTSRHIAAENDWDPNLVFRVDALAVHEALHNLFSNAIRYTPRHGTIRMATKPSAVLGYGVIVVEDSGPGIEDKERARILDGTVRLDPQHPGGGIGLAIVQSIVKAHAGVMAIDTSPLGGAALVLTLPLVDAD